MMLSEAEGVLGKVRFLNIYQIIIIYFIYRLFRNRIKRPFQMTVCFPFPCCALIKTLSALWAPTSLCLDW